MNVLEFNYYCIVFFSVFSLSTRNNYECAQQKWQKRREEIPSSRLNENVCSPFVCVCVCGVYCARKWEIEKVFGATKHSKIIIYCILCNLSLIITALYWVGALVNCDNSNGSHKRDKWCGENAYWAVKMLSSKNAILLHRASVWREKRRALPNTHKCTVDRQLINGSVHGGDNFKKYFALFVTFDFNLTFYRNVTFVRPRFV